MTPWVIYYRFHSSFGFDRFVKILESRKHFFTLRPQNSPNDPQNCYIMCVMWHSAAYVPVLSFGVEKTGYAPVSRERSDYATVPWGILNYTTGRAGSQPDSIIFSYATVFSENLSYTTRFLQSYGEVFRFIQWNFAEKHIVFFCQKYVDLSLKTYRRISAKMRLKRYSYLVVIVCKGTALFW